MHLDRTKHVLSPEGLGVQTQIISEHRIYSENSVNKDTKQDPEEDPADPLLTCMEVEPPTYDIGA